LETGIAMIGDEIELDINAEAIREEGSKNAPAK
jgi:hypothetical protein